MPDPLPTYSSLLVQISPPWLQRLVGERFLSALGAPIDAAYERARESIKQRFPLVVDDSSLAMVGRERRIRRGPAEDATTYARRLRTWWDAHRTRGGPYALLHQLDAFFEDWLNVRMDVVYYSGTRRWIDENSVVTRDAVTWDADGTGKWARFWVVFYVPATIPGADRFLVTDDGDFLVTDDGDFIMADSTIAVEAITPAEEAIFRAIPREWSAAHIDRIEVVLLWDDRRLWNYPQPVPTWAEWGSTSTWGEPPVVLPITD